MNLPEAIDSKNGLIRAIVESPKGSRNKYKYSQNLGLIECGPALKSGLIWPFNFGFIPHTLAEDGDPLDIVVLTDEPTFVGCLVHVKLIGVLEVKQIQDGKPIRNDRIIGLHQDSAEFEFVQTISDLSSNFQADTERFFSFYMHSKGKQFEFLGWNNPAIAKGILEESIKAAALVV